MTLQLFATLKHQLTVPLLSLFNILNAFICFLNWHYFDWLLSVLIHQMTVLLLSSLPLLLTCQLLSFLALSQTIHLPSVVIISWHLNCFHPLHFNFFTESRNCFQGFLSCFVSSFSFGLNLVSWIKTNLLLFVFRIQTGTATQHKVTLSCCWTADDRTVNQENGLWAAPGLRSIHYKLNIRGFNGCLSMLRLWSVTSIPRGNNKSTVVNWASGQQHAVSQRGSVCRFVCNLIDP